MDYTEIAIRVPVLYAEALAWHLQELGATGVVVSEIPAKGPAPETVQVKTYRPGVPEEQASWLAILERDLGQFAENFPGLAPTIATRCVPEEDWAHSWKQYWHAQRIGDHLVIKPSWEEFTPEPGDHVIELDPKQAFGTGTHATTQLCLRALEDVVPSHDAPLVFDVGTGSGILAIAAVLLGARRVEACDTDPVAVAATEENVRLNGVAERVHVRTGGIEVIKGQCDVLVVNILAEVVAGIASEIAERVRPGGDVLASGIIRERQALVESAFEAVGLSVLRIEYQDDWVLVQARKPDSFVIERD
ncbi:MAG TPA: 50S ribosomal protein L11 methyltransferase [Oscillatoriaceae cyanobacterium]